MVLRKNSSATKLLLVVTFMMIQLLHLSTTQVSEPYTTSAVCTADPTKPKSNDGLTTTTAACVASTAACTANTATKQFYAIGTDCFSCEVGYVRKSTDNPATCKQQCPGVKFQGYGTTCQTTETAATCSDGYLESATALPTASTTTDCLFCDIKNDYLRHNGRCLKISSICTGTNTAFDGTKCLAPSAFTQCATGYSALAKQSNLCIYCAIGYKKDPKTTACVRECPVTQGSTSTRFIGYNSNGQAICQASTANPASACTTTGYSNNPSDNTNNKECTKCDFGYINVKGKCLLADSTNCQTFAGKAAFDGTNCVDAPSSPNFITCDSTTNSEADYETNSCIFCKVGFRKLNGACVSVQSNSGCSTNQMWGGEACVAQATECPAGYASTNASPVVCDRCAFGYARKGGKCQLVSTVCDSLTIFKGYNGQQCVSTTNPVTCISNSFANDKTANLCVYCKLGYKLDKGKCIEVSCPTGQYWKGAGCVAKPDNNQLTCESGMLLDSSAQRCISCDFGFVPFNAGTDATTVTKCGAAADSCKTAFNGSTCVASLNNNRCGDPFYAKSTDKANICDGCNLGYVQSAGTCKKAEEVCTTTANPAYSGEIDKRECGPLTNLVNSKDCPQKYYAPNSSNTNLCTACDFRYVLYQGDCVSFQIGCTGDTPNYDGKKCVTSAGFKCLDEYEFFVDFPKYCVFCNVGFTYRKEKGGCVESTSTCPKQKPNFNGLECVGTQNFKCIKNATYGYHANQQAPTKCYYCEIGYNKILNLAASTYEGFCLNAIAQCSSNQKWNGKKCVSYTQSCLPGYTYNEGNERFCIFCDVGYKKINGSCIMINCTSDKLKFNGNQCDFQQVQCLTGYAASRENPLRCFNCALGYKKENGTCISAKCSGDKPKWSGTECVAATANCALGYAIGDNSNSCNKCAQKYEQNGGKCIQSCVAPNTKFIGNGCGAPNAQCAAGFKDNGEGKCIPNQMPCPEGYIFNGVKNCAKGCAPDFKNNGLNVCVSSKSACATGFTDVGGVCVIRSDKQILSLPRTNVCDPLCLQCDNSGNCNVCRNGYMLNEATKKCIPCQGCLTCDVSNSTECTSCFSPLVLSLDTKTCTTPSSCDKNCLQCNIAGRCLSCIQGYQALDGACQKCTVEGCIKCSSLASCQACGQGMKLDGNKCYPCTAGCLKCKLEDLSSCDGCVKGYYPFVNGSEPTRCQPCMEHCSVCQSAKTCSTCKQGYILSTNKEKCTLRCNSNCATCQENLPDKCSTCLTGGNLIQNSSKCEYSVTACNATSTCTFCPDGHVLSQKKCLKCTYATNSNCNACSPNTLSQCVGCVAGFYLQNKACVKCEAACFTCVGKEACLNCSVGFYLAQDQGKVSGSCRACDSSCLTCTTTSTQCTSCKTTSKLVGTNCISNNNVEVTTKLDIDIAKFYTIIEDYRKWVVDQANKAINSTTLSKANLYIKKITKGSTDIVSVLSLESQNANSIQNIANTISQAISSGGKIGNVAIQGGTTNANFIQKSGVTTNEESSSSKLGLILGLSIPLGLLFLVVVFVIICKLCQRKKEEEIYKDSTAVKNHSTKNLDTGDRQSEKV